MKIAEIIQEAEQTEIVRKFILDRIDASDVRAANLESMISKLAQAAMRQPSLAKIGYTSLKNYIRGVLTAI